MVKALLAVAIVLVSCDTFRPLDSVPRPTGSDAADADVGADADSGGDLDAVDMPDLHSVRQPTQGLESRLAQRGLVDDSVVQIAAADDRIPRSVN